MIIKSINDTFGYKGLPDGFRVEFDDSITYIVGDNFKTKTTILGVPLWVLTGYNMNGGNQENVANDNNQNISNVTAEITIIDNNGELHVIKRSKGHNNIVTIDGYKATKEDLATFYKDIQFFICSYNPYRFSNLEPVKQKELLLRLLPKVSKMEIYNTLTSEEKEIITSPIEDYKVYNQNRRAEIKELEFEKSRCNGVIDSQCIPAFEIEEEKQEFTKQKLLNELENQYEMLLANCKDGESINSLNKKINILTEKIENILNIDLKEIKERKNKIKERLKDTENAICKFCRQPITNQEILENLRRQDNRELEKLDKQTEKLKNETKEYLREMKEKKKLLAELSTSDNIEKEQHKNVIKQQIDELLKEKQNIEIKNREIETKKASIKYAKEQIGQAKNKIEECENQIFLKNKQIKICNKLNTIHIEKQMETIMDKLDKVSITFSKYDANKMEFVDDYAIKYEGRDYSKLSRSQKMRADFEIANLINSLSGINSPMFIDDTESIRDIEINTENQIITAIFIKHSDLDIFYNYEDVLQRKKESIEKQLGERREFVLLKAA